ncbi:MAG: tRNA/tmRNA (uracil-C(5))-methyltransferase [candidate division BRC1 bacterium ADurb.BinA364]|nr:MAG: tRNA/tmRNA (uracil-C(5))-methyltransferase [candidate division BRC1 bacterium ADurb.BinA364]
MRASSEEIAAAIAGSETLKRMQGIDLASYRFSSLFVDPPRSGLDARTLEFAAGFEHILYISCNPQTLQANVAAIARTSMRRIIFDFLFRRKIRCANRS